MRLRRLVSLAVALLGVAGVAGAATFADDLPTIGEKPPQLTSSTTATFSFGDAGAASFQCRLDAASFEACTSPVTYTSLADGAHTFSVRSVDAGGAPGSPATYSWEIDTAAPALTLVSPADGSSIATATPDVAGTAGIAAGDSPTVHVQVRQGTSGGGQPVRRLTAPVDPVTGAWSVGVTPELPEGTYNVKADQSDEAGNATETPRHVFTVDVTPPPAPTVSGPAPRTGSATAQLSFSSGEAGLTYLCALDGAASEPCASPKVYSGLSAGAHTVSVRARDAAGNTSAATSHAWTVDLSPPAVTLTSPAPGTATSNTSPLASGTGGTALGDAASVRVDVWQGASTAGAPIRSPSATVNPATGAWSIAITPALGEGTYTIRASQVDDVGNVGTSGARTFVVDVTPPAAPSVSGPAARTKATSAQIEFGHAEPGVTFVCRLDAGPEAPCTSPVTFSNLTQALHQASVRARDAAGNTGPAATHAWTVDTTPPAVAVVSPAAGSVTSNVSPAVSGTAGTAPGDLPAVEVTLRQGNATVGPAFRTLSATAVAGGGWTATVAPALPAGTYTVVARQTDDVGNETITSGRTFAVDLSVPTVGLASPANGAVTRARTPTFQGTADQASVSVNVYSGSAASGTPIRTATAAVTSGAWSLAFPAEFDDGVYAAVARATNPAGTTGSSNASVFVVDNGPPSFTSVPENQTLEQVALEGTVATFAPTAADALDPSPQITCTPPSGSVFPRRVTQVSCTATDWAGLTAQAGFSVTVANTIAPATVADVRATAGNGVVRLAWTRPTDWDVVAVQVLRSPQGKGAFKQVFRSASATSFADRTVVNDRRYDYRVRAVDVGGNLSPIASVSARPSAFLAPAWEDVVEKPPVLRWARVGKANYYNVQVWRNGRKILSRWPAGPSYGLGASWTFQGRRYRLTPGTYVAYAWPGFGPKSAGRYGKLVGWTKFVVR